MTKDEIIESARNDHNNGMTYKAIAEKYNVSVSAVKSWASRKWNKVATKPKKVANKKKKLQLLKSVTDEQVDKLTDDILDNKLTAKQQLFVAEYLRTSNATQSYMNAYGVKYDVANVEGPKSLVKPSIQQVIKTVRKSQLKYIGVDIAGLINDVAKEAKADIGDYLEFASHDELITDMDGNVQLDTNDNPVVKHYSQVWVKDKAEVDTSLIKKVSVGKDGVQLELHDKTKARDKLIDWLTGDKSGKDKLDNEKRKVEIEIMKAKLKLLTNDDDKLDEPIRELIAGLDAIANGDAND